MCSSIFRGCWDLASYDTTQGCFKLLPWYKGICGDLKADGIKWIQNIPVSKSLCLPRACHFPCLRAGPVCICLRGIDAQNIWLPKTQAEQKWLLGMGQQGLGHPGACTAVPRLAELQHPVHSSCTRVHVESQSPMAIHGKHIGSTGETERIISLVNSCVPSLLGACKCTIFLEGLRYSRDCPWV